MILGSFPSVKSREAGFFYDHPQNRFWRVTAEVMGVEYARKVGHEVEEMLEEEMDSPHCLYMQ